MCKGGFAVFRCFFHCVFPTFIISKSLSMGHQNPLSGIINVSGTCCRWKMIQQCKNSKTEQQKQNNNNNQKNDLQNQIINFGSTKRLLIWKELPTDYLKCLLSHVFIRFLHDTTPIQASLSLYYIYTIYLCLLDALMNR